MDDFHRIKVDEGIHKFIKNILRIVKGYNKYFNNKFEVLTYKYLQDLIDIQWKGNSFTHENRYSKIEYFIKFRLSDKVQRIKHKLVGKDTGYEFVPKFPKMDMYLAYCTKEEFYNKTKNYTESIFNEVNPNKEYEYLAFDQLVPPTNIMRYMNYFNNLKVIVVDKENTSDKIFYYLNFYLLVFSVGKIIFLDNLNNL